MSNRSFTDLNKKSRFGAVTKQAKDSGKNCDTALVGVGLKRIEQKKAANARASRTGMIVEVDAKSADGKYSTKCYAGHEYQPGSMVPKLVGPGQWKVYNGKRDADKAVRWLREAKYNATAKPVAQVRLVANMLDRPFGR